MGNILPLISNICPGKYCAKYVCNAMHVHSKCGEDCCDLEVETTEIRDESDEEIEIDTMQRNR